MRINTQWIKFKGRTSGEMGVEVIELPPLVIPALYGDMRHVQGVGDMWIDGGGPKSVKRGALLRTLPGANRIAIMRWLSGPGRLIASDMPDKAMRAHAVSEAAFEPFLPCGKNTIGIDFTCAPYLYEAEPEEILIRRSGVTVAAPADVLDGKPIFTVYGTGAASVTVGGISVGMTLDGEHGIMVDCEARLAITEGTNEAVEITLTDSQWPELDGGISAIEWTGSVDRIAFRPNWRW